MSNEPLIHEPQSLLEVREWKNKVSAEIERLGFAVFREKCGTDADLKAMRERVLLHQRPANKAA
jgi:hypothetical protein